jgi:hypothetical protein
VGGSVTRGEPFPDTDGLFSESSVHDDHALRSLKELVRSYLTITKDLGRVMSRVKAIYQTRSVSERASTPNI